MSLLSYFLNKTGAPEKFKTITKYTTIDGKKFSDLKIGDECVCSSFELGHKIYANDSNIMYETFFSNGKHIVRNHLSTHTTNGNIIQLLTYYGDNDKFDTTLDVCYMVDLINETLASHEHDSQNHSQNNGQFWDEIIVSTNDLENISVNITTSGFLISKDQKHNPKKIRCNGKLICELLGSDLEICYVDYLKYEGLNVLMYCQKYDIEQELKNDFNKSASDISKRKIVGHSIIVSNDCDVDEKYMTHIVVAALNFNQKKYDDMQKKNLLQMYAKAYIIQNPKTK
jgi:hypothetical protein